MAKAGATSSPEPGNVSRNGDVSRSSIWIYGSLGFPLALLGYPLGIWLPRAYDTYIGIDTAMVGLIISVAAIFDAVTDPAMGYASDSFRSRWGRRRAWVLVGAPFLALALYYLLNPDKGSTVLYLGAWFVFLRLGTTMLGVPYAAWGMELSGEYNTRTRIQSAREIFVLLGLIGAAAVPAVVEAVYGDEATAVQVLNAYTWLAVPLLLAITVLVVWRVPEPPPRVNEGKVKFLQSLGLMYKNKLYLRVITIEFLVGGGEAFRNALSLYFMQDYIGAPRAGTLYLVYFLFGLGAIPVWNLLARRYGKHRSLSAAIILVGAVSIAIFTLDYGQIWPFYVLFAIKGFCFGSFAYLPRAMLADVIDLDTLRSGDARTGGYYSIYGFMTKVAQSIGGTSLIALSIIGYNTAIDASNGPTELLWLGVLYAIVPTVLFTLALYLCWTWPLTSKKHAQLQRLLETREARRSVEASEAA
ncbi:MAG: MFS transporter [Gammaproteobacteria bacterium]|nr:MAG: MFS transporter [Gammaproteobacteria bacterium]